MKLVAHYTLRKSYEDNSVLPDESGNTLNKGTISGGKLNVSNDSPRSDFSCSFLDLEKPIINFSKLNISNGSVTFWGKFNSISPCILCGSDDTYLFMNYSNNKWSFSNCGSNIQVLVDGMENYSLDNKWHFYSVTGIDFSKWEKIYLNKKEINGNITDLRFFEDILTLKDIDSIRNIPIYISKNNSGLNTSGEFIESDKIAFGRNGNIEIPELIEGSEMSFSKNGKATFKEFIEW